MPVLRLVCKQALVESFQGHASAECHRLSQTFMARNSGTGWRYRYTWKHHVRNRAVVGSGPGFLLYADGLHLHPQGPLLLSFRPETRTCRRT